MSKMSYDIPILIIAFNRPEVSRNTFEVIKQLKPSTLFVAVDGPRDYIFEEAEKVNEVLDIYHEIDWPCNAYYHKNTTNLGAELTVSNAISWVLDNNEYCIVLEDDILASKSFFDFAEQMLIKYKDFDNVYLISAAQFSPMESMATDYVFSIYGHTGFGWATWRRAWSHFSMNISDFDMTLHNPLLKNNFPSKKAYKGFIKGVRKMKKLGSKNCSWDRCWSYIRSRDGGLSIVPKCNLNQNIGVWGLHANGIVDYHKLRGAKNFTVRKHPDVVSINFDYDKYHFDNYLHHSLRSKFFIKLKNIVK